MSLYVKVFTNFYTHRKTMRLRAVLGDDAFWVPPRLWAYAAENQPDGDFSSYTDSEIAMLVGYMKDATSMLQALISSGFVDPDRKIHDWAEHNSYHQVFADRARKAALAKWDKEKKNQKEKEENTDDRKGEDRRQARFKHASSRNEDENPTISLSSISEKEQVQYELNAHRVCLKGTPEEDRKERARHTKAIENLERKLTELNGKT